MTLKLYRNYSAGQFSDDAQLLASQQYANVLSAKAVTLLSLIRLAIADDLIISHNITGDKVIITVRKVIRVHPIKAKLQPEPAAFPFQPKYY